MPGEMPDVRCRPDDGEGRMMDARRPTQVMRRIPMPDAGVADDDGPDVLWCR